MGSCISCLVSETCAYFCGSMSIFAIVILFLLAWAVGVEYRFVGQAWKGKGENAQTNEEAVKVILATVGIYTAFLVASCLCLAGNAAKRKLIKSKR